MTFFIRTCILCLVAICLTIPATTEEQLIRVRREEVSEPVEYCYEDAGMILCYTTQEELDASIEENEDIDSDLMDDDDDDEEEGASLGEQLLMSGRRAKSGTPDVPTGKKLGKKYQRWRAVVKMISHIVSDPNLTRKQIIKRLLNYGCHCFPGTKRLRSVGGKGPAMDDLDALCRTQFQCHKCVEMEQNCDPDTTPYKAKFYGNRKSTDREIYCGKNAEGSCSRNLCECDKKMAHSLADMWSDSLHNGFYWRDRRNMRKNDTFDYDNICVIAGLTAQSDACCGTFPDVIPYSSSTKDCCEMSDGPKLYDALTHQCCPSGVGLAVMVTQTGSC